MVRRLFTLLLALVGLTSAWAEDYPMKIGGVQVTSDNYQNITAAGGFSAVKSGAGTVTFNPTTKTLTLSNAVIEAPTYAAIEFESSPSYLVLADGTTNRVTTSANVYPTIGANNVELTIEGGGTGNFTCTGSGINASGIINRAQTLIRNCTASFVGTTNGISANSLTIDNATVMALGEGNASIRCGQLNLQGVEIQQPSGAYFRAASIGICEEGTSTLVKTEVVISGPVPETVAPERVLNVTRYDVDGSGTVTLSDLTLLANALVGKVNYPVTNLGLPQLSYTLLVGQPKIILPVVVPANADYPQLAWTTSNKYVATVKDSLVAGRKVGVVWPKKVGTCTITASAMDGSNRSVSCDVTVKQGVSNITLSTTNLSLSEFATHQLTATVLPSNAYDTSVKWTTSNALVATVSSTGVVTPTTREGTCTITCTANDGSGVTATCQVSVYWVDQSGTIGGHQYVDLGLPSRTLWAATNLGATSPEGYGNYYAWGETSSKTEYRWSNYFDATNTNSGYPFTIYNLDGGLTELQTTHDAAYVNWGSNWRIPTNEQVNELRSNCERRWTSDNGVPGYEFTGKGGNTIFLPAAGYRGTSLGELHETGCYWTRNLSSSQNNGTFGLSLKFEFGAISAYSWYRYLGYSIRPVRNQ